MELWNNQFSEFKLLQVPVSRRMSALVCKASRDKVDVDAFHKVKRIQFALESLNCALEEQQYQILKAKDTKFLGTRLLITPELRLLGLTKKHVGSGNDIGCMVFKSELSTSKCQE